jgi:hypothetical protein
MPYVSRLIADTGIGTPLKPEAGSADETSIEMDATLAVSSNRPAADATAMLAPVPPTAEAHVTPPAAPDERDHTVMAVSAVGVAPLGEAREHPSRFELTAGDAPEPVTQPAAASHSEAGLPQETAATGDAMLSAMAEESIQRTLAIVREWTSAAPPDGAPAPSAVLPAPAAAPTVPDAHADLPPRPRLRPHDQDLSQPEGVVVVGARAPGPPATSRSGLAAVPAGEPEVVNVNLSIGSIELTLEAPESSSPPPSPVQHPRPEPSAADSAALLRRHYVRPSIGW